MKQFYLTLLRGEKSLTDKNEKNQSLPEEEEKSTDTFNDLDRTDNETPADAASYSGDDQDMPEERLEEVEPSDTYEPTNDEVSSEAPTIEETDDSLEDELAAVPIIEEQEDNTVQEENSDTEESDVSEKRSKEPLSPFQRFLNIFDTTYEVAKQVIFVLALILIIGGAFVGGAGAG